MDWGRDERDGERERRIREKTVKKNEKQKGK
jgi:hypothetical protein